MKLLERLLMLLMEKVPIREIPDELEIGKILSARNYARANKTTGFVDLETEETLLGGRVSMRVTFDFTESN